MISCGIGHPADLTRRGFGVLAASHAVPVQLWLHAPDGSALLRSECDCEEHRTAGAGVRTVLNPGALPRDEAVFDGAAQRGWRGYEAGLLDVTSAAEIFDGLLAELTAGTARGVEAVEPAGAGLRDVAVA